MFFSPPSAVVAGEAPANHPIRVGGLVTTGSVERHPDGLTVRFDITDNAETITVQYTGILPDLFREGQGIVALGQLGKDQLFVANDHDAHVDLRRQVCVCAEPRIIRDKGERVLET